MFLRTLLTLTLVALAMVARVGPASAQDLDHASEPSTPCPSDWRVEWVERQPFREVLAIYPPVPIHPLLYDRTRWDVRSVLHAPVPEVQGWTQVDAQGCPYLAWTSDQGPLLDVLRVGATLELPGRVVALSGHDVGTLKTEIRRLLDGRQCLGIWIHTYALNQPPTLVLSEGLLASSDTPDARLMLHADRRARRSTFTLLLEDVPGLDPSPRTVTLEVRQDGAVQWSGKVAVQVVTPGPAEIALPRAAALALEQPGVELRVHLPQAGFTAFEVPPAWSTRLRCFLASEAGFDRRYPGP